MTFSWTISEHQPSNTPIQRYTRPGCPAFWHNHVQSKLQHLHFEATLKDWQYNSQPPCFCPTFPSCMPPWRPKLSCAHGVGQCNLNCLSILYTHICHKQQNRPEISKLPDSNVPTNASKCLAKQNPIAWNSSLNHRKSRDICI